jgi:MFS family permease
MSFQPGSSSATSVTGLVLLFTSLVATPFMDRIGRKTALVGGGALIGGSLLMIGSLYASNANRTAGGRIAIIAFIELFVVSFSVTWAMHSESPQLYLGND